MYFAMSDASNLVKFYAKQIIGLLILWVVIFLVTWIPVIGWIFGPLMGLVLFIVWVVLVINALQGKEFRVPVMSDMMDNILK
jgi:uncharacterized membrane protein